MPIDNDFLISKILDFLTVLYRCWSETNYTQDRPIFANDIATAVGWLARLHQRQTPIDVATTIIDSSTTKYFTDYWRQGHWGDLEAEALKDLQDSIKAVIGS